MGRQRCIRHALQNSFLLYQEIIIHVLKCQCKLQTCMSSILDACITYFEQSTWKFMKTCRFTSMLFRLEFKMSQNMLFNVNRLVDPLLICLYYETCFSIELKRVTAPWSIILNFFNHAIFLLCIYNYTNKLWSILRIK